MAIPSADGVVAKDRLAGSVFLGELGLDGSIRAVPGGVAVDRRRCRCRFSRAVVPVENAAEAALVPAMRVIAAPTLSGLVGWLRGGNPDAPGWDVQVVYSGAGLAAPRPAG